MYQDLDVVHEDSAPRGRQREAEWMGAHSGAIHSGAILDASLDGIVIIDPRGRILEFNPAAQQMFGPGRFDVLSGGLSFLATRTSRQCDPLLHRFWRYSYRHGIRTESDRFDEVTGVLAAVSAAIMVDERRLRRGLRT